MSLRSRISQMLAPARLGTRRPPLHSDVPTDGHSDVPVEQPPRPLRGVTADPTDPRLGRGVDENPVDQHDVYLVLSPEERARGFVRPLRTTYVHARELGGCGTATTMGMSIAETYARKPHFYGATYCCGCRMHRPVGAAGEFYWDATKVRVGT